MLQNPGNGVHAGGVRNNNSLPVVNFLCVVNLPRIVFSVLLDLLNCLFQCSWFEGVGSIWTNSPEIIYVHVFLFRFLIPWRR